MLIVKRTLYIFFNNYFIQFTDFDQKPFIVWIFNNKCIYLDWDFTKFCLTISKRQPVSSGHSLAPNIRASGSWELHFNDRHLIQNTYNTIESDKITSIYNVSTRVLSKK